MFPSQRIRSTVDEKEQKQLLMDLDVVMRSSDCPYIVQFYGALFREVKLAHILASDSFSAVFDFSFSCLNLLCFRVTVGFVWNLWLPR